MKSFLLVFLLCLPLPAQLSYGIIAGVPFSNLTTGAAVVDKSTAFTIGPTVQFGLPLGLRVEADALYRSAGYSASQWRFPLLVQYRLGTPILKPFVEAGYSYDHINLTVAPNYSITSQHGFVLGGGVDVKIPFIRISPEIRYTHDLGSGASNILQTNQAEFLVGLRF